MKNYEHNLRRWRLSRPCVALLLAKPHGTCVKGATYQLGKVGGR
jgi:hypothetical protein